MASPSTTEDTKEVKEEKTEEPLKEEEQLAEPEEEGKDETNLSEEEKEAKRYEYWQSKHDKLLKELEATKSKSEINQDYAPIAEYLYQNPAALLAPSRPWKT